MASLLCQLNGLILKNNVLYISNTNFDPSAHTLICIHHDEHDNLSVTYNEETNSLRSRHEVSFTGKVSIFPIKGTIVKTAYHQYEDHGWTSKSSARLFVESIYKLKMDKIIYINVDELNHIDILSVNDTNIDTISKIKSHFWLGGLIFTHKVT